MLFLIIVIIGKVGVTGPIPVTSSITRKSLKRLKSQAFSDFLFANFKGTTLFKKYIRYTKLSF